MISDRHNRIKAVLEEPDGGWVSPAAYRAFCIRHVAVNFALSFKGKDASRILVDYLNNIRCTIWHPHELVNNEEYCKSIYNQLVL